MNLLAIVLATLAPWTTTPAALKTMPRGSVTILDARGWLAYYIDGHIPGAVHTAPFACRRHTGPLSQDDANNLAHQLADAGVDLHRPVVVYDNGHDGHGTAGCVVWLLRYLGHPDAALLEGGWHGWLAAGGRVAHWKSRPLPGSFAARPVPILQASDEDVQQAAAHGVTLLDVRSDNEWRGERPFFAPYRQRIRGAVHLAWTELRDDATGRVDRLQKVYQRLRALGLERWKPVIVYSTDGIQSAEALVMLKALGFRVVRNYDDSWYDWTGDKSLALSDSP